KRVLSHSAQLRDGLLGDNDLRHWSGSLFVQHRTAKPRTICGARLELALLISPRPRTARSLWRAARPLGRVLGGPAFFGRVVMACASACCLVSRLGHSTGPPV